MPFRHSTLLLQVVVLLACCGLFFFYGLGSVGLVGADEPRYAQIAREMLARHDWVTPVLNGVAWLEKPVLYYWGAMLSYSAFGVSDWAARVPTAALATLMVLAVYAFVRRFRPGAQFDAALILTTLAGVIGFARAASTDMPLTAMFAIGMLAWFAWYDTRKRTWLLVFYASMALGTLAKGPVAPFLAGLVIVMFVALIREWKVIAGTLNITGVLLYLFIALPWFVLVQHANPQFVRVFVFEHNLARYSSNVFQHHQPFWYYAPVLLAALLPWLAWCAAGAVESIRRGSSDRLGIFLLVWGAVPVIFFSFSGSKLPGYILPALAPFAILASDYARKREARLPLGPSALHGFLTGLLVAAALLTNYFVLRLKPTPAAMAIAVAAGLVCWLGIVIATRKNGIRRLSLVTVGSLVIAFTFVVRFAAASIDAVNSSRPVSQRLHRIMPERNSVAVAVLDVPRQVEYGLNYYENKPISRYERGEVPTGEHVVVARPGALKQVESYTNKPAVDLGGFAAQKLEFYYVSGH